jgi:uncharacterized OsmC-like protein
MSESTLRTVSLRRTGPGQLVAVNASGAELPVGSAPGAFSPIELLLTGLAGCTGLDVEALTRRRAEPDSFEVVARADKVRTESGNQLANVEVVFRVSFPAGEAGDAARSVLPEAVARSHDRLCTVSRTLQRPTPVTTRIE